ncbi:hypothetical protein [Leptotrichia massiliensis]|jgi:hypothetical protein
MENNYEENQLEIFSNQYLKEIGMGIDEDLSDFNINSNKYKKIDDSLATRLNSLIQLFPNLINLSNYSGDVYRVVFDKGLGVLQTSAKYPGYFTGNVVQAGTNNKIVSGAVFQQLSMAPQIISGVFSVMSIVTGQYYMSQINNNLQKMEKEISDIKQYLKDDKKSRLLSREEFLRTTQDSLNYILENDMQKLSTITSIQKIKIDSLADINFYKMQINNLEDLSAEKDKIEEILMNVYEKCELISEYWYSLYLYCFAVYLEALVSQNYNQDYLKILKKDIAEKCRTYKNEHFEWKKELSDYIYSAKAFETNKILEKTGKVLGNIPSFSIETFIIKNLGKKVTGIISEIDKLIKEGKRGKISKLKDKLLNTGEDIKEIESRKEDLFYLEFLYNSRIELIKNKEGVYIKLPEKVQTK